MRQDGERGCNSAREIAGFALEYGGGSHGTRRLSVPIRHEAQQPRRRRAMWYNVGSNSRRYHPSVRIAADIAWNALELRSVFGNAC